MSGFSRPVVSGFSRPVVSGFSQTSGSVQASNGGNPKDAFLAALRGAKAVFYNTVVAQAQKIEVTGDRIVFTFAPGQRAIQQMFDQNRAWLESIALQVAGRKMTVGAIQGDAPAAAPDASPAAAADKEKKAALKEQALADPGVQSMLEVFAAEIRDVEEM